MSGSVTVPGAHSSTITATFDNSSNFGLAQQIADALAAAGKDGSLSVTSVHGKSPIPNPISGELNELILGDVPGGQVTIPSASPGYVVVLQNEHPLTITGGPNTTIFGGAGGGVTVNDPAAIVLAEEAGNASATVSGNGDVLAGNNLNDTLTAAGANESVAGGTGNNLIF